MDRNTVQVTLPPEICAIFASWADAITTRSPGTRGRANPGIVHIAALYRVLATGAATLDLDTLVVLELRAGLMRDFAQEPQLRSEGCAVAGWVAEYMARTLPRSQWSPRPYRDRPLTIR